MTYRTPRHVLMVAAEFPPVKTIGRLRTMKFIEHLRAHGWSATVLTVAMNGTSIVADPALEHEIPAGTPVHRTACPDLEALAADCAKRVLGRHRAKGDAGDPPAAGTVPAAAREQPVMDRLHATMTSCLRNTVHVPDPYILWVPGAIRAGLRICRERKVDAIHTTLPPFSAALIGNRLKRRTGLPWIVDYRDLWFGDVLRDWVPPVRRRLELWLERRWIAPADAIVAVSAEKTEFLRTLHAGRDRILETITNGYDAEEFADIGAYRRQDPATISFVFTGRLFKNRQGYAFAEALGRLKAERPDLAAAARVFFYGGVSPEIRARYDEILARHDLAGQVRFAGDVPHAEAKAAQVNADYLLLIVDTGETSDGVIPGKLFEYVAAGRPIFALTDPGATATIIRRGRLGRVVDARDVEGCRNALADLLSRPVPERLDADADYLGQFDRRAVTARLAGLLDRVTEPGEAAARRLILRASGP
ncbi:MAG TPA: glycosyltransferase [Arenibaculum sp.]|nr:glycosyltransferase [Arenibaculum sp.]